MKQSRKRYVFFTSITLFVLGTGVLFYPLISNYREMRIHENIIRGYEESIISSDKKKMDEEWKKAEEYNQKIRDDYEDILDPDGNGVMAYIEIPKIEVQLPIYHGSEEESLKKGVGHIEKSSFPIGGEGTNCILTGHRGLPSAELFTRLDELKEKDLVYIHVLNQTLAYEVDQINVVLPEQVDQIEQDPEKDYITLVTCTPYGVNSHRLLVRGKRTEYEVRTVDVGNKQEFLIRNRIYILTGLFAGLMILFAAGKICLEKRRRGKRRKRKKR